MKKFLSIMLLIMFVSVTPSWGAFWNRNKTSAPTSGNTAQNQQQSQYLYSQNQSQQDQGQTQQQASYPQDVNGSPISPGEYVDMDNIDIEKMYRDMPVPTFKYIHDVDPDATILAYESTPYDTTPFNMAIEGFDYVIIRENYTMVDPVLEYVTTIKEKGMIIGMSIYKNPDAIHSVFSQKDIDSYIYDSEHPFISANIFTNGYMNTKDIFDITDGTVSSDRSYNDRSETFHYSVYSPGEAYAKTYKTEYIGDNSSRKEYDTIQSIPVNRFNSYTTEFAVLNQDGYNSFINVCKKSNENTRISPNKSGNIQALDAGSMIIPVQNSSNLKIFNNSKKSKFRSVLQGCILLGIDKGDNKISINYSFIYFIIGFIISALSFILFILKNKYLQKSKMKSFIKKTNCFIKSNYVYIVTFLILTITFISAQIITGTIPFGRKPTIRDDAISQSFAYYVEKVRLVKNGMPFSWISNNIGMSRDITLSSLTSIPSPRPRCWDPWPAA